MGNKIKAFLIYGVSFLAIFLILRFALLLFMAKGFWTTFIPIIASAVFAPKPHKEQTENGVNYGLKSVFSKKIIRF